MHHCYQNNKIIPVSEATMQINDLGLLRGYGLFDYFRTYNGKPFQWDWYWKRYENSAKILRLNNPITKREALNVVMKLIALSGSGDCAIRFLLSGGYSEDSVSSPKTNLLIISEDVHSPSKEEYQQGMKVISYEYVRDLPEVKSTDYKHFMLLQQDIKAANAIDVIYHKRGFISELSRSNVFILQGENLITPQKNVLKGITRKTVLGLAKPHFNIEQRNVKLSEVLAADEVFVTSTTRRVFAISQIDEHIIGKGIAGEKTKFLNELFNDLVAKW